MTSNKSSSFISVAFTHFVPCLFLGVFHLYLLDSLVPKAIVTTLADQIFSPIDFLMAGFNGLAVMFWVFIFHYRRNKRLRSLKAKSRRPYESKRMRHALAVGFLGGSLDVLLGLHTIGLIPLTLLVLGILFWHLKVFAMNLTTMLRPNNVASWSDVSELFRIYLNMLAGFTLVNATLEGAHILAGTPPPFGFTVHGGDIFLNSLYYTVVTMTTLGYGDIVPKTWDAKLLLIFQCMVSYVMFALMVGIITRGVVSVREKESRR